MLNFKDIISGLLIAAIWGGNFLMVRMGLEALPPFTLLTLRFFFVSLILLPFVPKSKIKFNNLLALAFNIGVVQHGLLFYAIWLKIDISASIIIFQSSVPLTAILGMIFLRETLTKKVIGGILFSFLGIIIIAGDPNLKGGYIPILMMILSATSMAFFNIQIKRLGDFHIFSQIAYSSMLATLMLLILSILFEEMSSDLLSSFPKALIPINYMVFSSIIGFGLWFRLMKKYPVGRVAPFLLFIPVFGLIFAYIFLQKPLTINLIVGSIVTIAGVAVILIPKLKTSLKKTNPKKEVVIYSED